MSNCDAAENNATAGQQREMSSARCKDGRVRLTQVVLRHDHSASAAAHGYAAPTIASQLRTKLSGLADTSPCQRYKSAEPFLPLCHKRRDASKTTTAAKPSHGKCSTKKVTSENNALKFSERAVRVHPFNKAPSSGNDRLSERHHHHHHHPLQANELKYKNENQQFSSSSSNSQLKDLNCDKGRKEQKVPQLAKASSARKVSTARRPDEKSKEVLRGIPAKLNQTKRTTVGKMTQSRAAPDLSKTICDMKKKDPLFEQMVEEEQHRWLAEVKEIEDKRKECYCINENLRINFKVDWISCSKGAAPIPANALDSTSQHMEGRNKDFTENLDVQVNTGKSGDKKMKEEVIDGSGVIWETSIVEGVLVDAYRLLCEETSVGDADQFCQKEMFVQKAENGGGGCGKIADETSVEEAGTACVLKLNSQPEVGHGDRKSAEETESEKNYFDDNSVAEMEPSWLDGKFYDKKCTSGQESSLSADSCRLHDGKSSELEKSIKQFGTGMSQVGSQITDDVEVKYEIEKLREEVNAEICTDSKESLLDGSLVAAESENAGDCMIRDVSLPKVEANNFAADAETLVSNDVVSGYELFCDAAEKDDIKDIVLQLSDVELEAGAFEGKSDAVVIQDDVGMGGVDGRSAEEISLEKQQVTIEANGQTGFERKDDEMNNDVFEDLHSLVNVKSDLYSEMRQTQSEEGFYETENSEMPVHVIEELDQNASASQVETTEAGSDSLSTECISYDDQNVKHIRNSSERNVDSQESFQMSKEKLKSCQEDGVMKRCQEVPHLLKSAPRETLDNIRNEADMQMSFQRKSYSTGSHQDNNGVESIVSCDASGLTQRFGKNLKQNLTIKENQKNVKKERAASSNIRYDCDMEDDDDASGFNATVAVRDGASARHSTTVDVVCMDAGSGHASVNPLLTLISDSISA